MDAPTVVLTESAARRIGQLAAEEKDARLMLRVTINGGGCSGFQYAFSLDSAVGDDDVVFEQHGARLVVDRTSLDLLAGAEVDFVQDLVGSAFAIRNPNARSSCGCGASFST
ncbi:MAG: iron-sulfur cluster insertion protein ErpA [Proteobacteria bacterium]|nr:iron-sulfur cluster insertion protein ErpA [Pseudomonadota bacterium]